MCVCVCVGVCDVCRCVCEGVCVHVSECECEGVLTVMTARALLSVKSIPALTLPLHTAKNSAPV